ncbi:MAG TPA: CRISPR-associated protein Csx19 [Ktedonobacteraceae bacterium]|jgi:hypothetical protein|nr:CRISPR-associated protein Csx19 [Ktedonobacteraceae bacterium]
MSEILYAGTIDIDKIEPLIADCRFPANALFLAEQLPDRAVITPSARYNLLRFTALAEAPSPATYSSGRVFYNDAELRWEREGDKMHVIYLGSQERAHVLSSYGLKKKDELEKETTRYYYLFGERLRGPDLEKIGPQARPGDFAEVRIPRILRYPVPQDEKRYVRLAVCEYSDAATRQVALFRFQGLEAFSWPGKQGSRSS